MRKNGQVAVVSIAPSAGTAKLIRRVSEYGFKPVIVTTRTKERSLLKVCADVRLDPPQVITIHSFEKGESTVDELALKLGGLDLVDWININDQVSVPYLLAIERLQLSFPFLSTYTACRLKPVARQLAFEANVSSVRPVIASIDEPFATVSRYVPFVAKPIAGAGSRFVKGVSNAADWRNHQAAMQADPTPRLSLGRISKLLGLDDVVIGRDLLIEPVLEGVEVEIDGYVHNNCVKVCAIGFKYHEETDVGFRELGCLMRAPRTDGIDRRIVSWGKKLLSAVGFITGTFHIEAMILNDGAIELIEINPRPGGGTIIEMVEDLSGVNLGDEFAGLWCGRSAMREPMRQERQSLFCLIRYAWRDGKVEYIANGPRSREWRLSFLGNDYRAFWTPLVKRGRRVSTKDGEVYLGEMKILDLDVPHAKVHDAVKKLRKSWFERLPLVRVS